MVIETFTLIAYINPGTGSLFLQFLLVSLAGVWVAFQNFGRWIKGRVIRKRSTPPSQEPDGR